MKKTFVPSMVPFLMLLLALLLICVLGLTIFINVRRQIKKHRKSEAK